ncbi:hypothetical protein [Ornithinimicrobium kibberense]|uniref:hypothetical protein n=1 Tax=Ornithinimicrobium kibberense TaxID=282060 RepID=UPI00360F4714
MTARAEAPCGVGHSRGATCCTRPRSRPWCITPTSAPSRPRTGTCRTGSSPCARIRASWPARASRSPHTSASTR